jgi:hypothetical protein
MGTWWLVDPSVPTMDKPSGHPHQHRWAGAGSGALALNHSLGQDGRLWNGASYWSPGSRDHRRRHCRDQGIEQRRILDPGILIAGGPPLPGAGLLGGSGALSGRRCSGLLAISVHKSDTAAAAAR